MSGTDSLRRYSPSDLEPHLLDLPSESTPGVTLEQNGNGRGEAGALLDLVRGRIPGWVLAAVERGPEAYAPPPRPDGTPRDSSPSGADSAACYHLARAGLTDAQIRAIYACFPLGTRGKYARKGRGDRYLADTLSKVRGLLAGEKEARLNDGAGEEVPQLPEEPGLLLSEVEPEDVDWLWEGWLALGKLALLDGDPGLGKSALTLDLAARVSAGLGFPDGAPCEPAGVVLISAEDGIADTVRPRLDAAGADASRILALTMIPDAEGGERLLSIPEDLPHVARGIDRVGARLVVVDPLMAFLSGGVDSHKDQDVRRALAPLARLADTTGVAVVVVRHLNKGTHSNPLYRGGASIGIIGAARLAYLVAKDPQDEERRVLAATKSNLARPPESFLFAVEGASNGAARVGWLGRSEASARDLLSSPQDRDRSDARDEAVEFLTTLLTGGPVSAREAKDEARDIGITEITLKRAKKLLGVVTYRENEVGEGRGAGRWMWKLPVAPLAGKGAQGGDRHDQRDHSRDGHPVDPLEDHRAAEPRQTGATKPNVQGDQGPSPVEDPLGREDRGGPEPASAGSPLDAMLDERPGWVRTQARMCLEEGRSERLMKPLASSIAARYLGDVHRGHEVLPFLREHLEHLA